MTISQESADKETTDSEMHILDVQVGQWVVVVMSVNLLHVLLKPQRLQEVVGSLHLNT